MPTGRSSYRNAGNANRSTGAPATIWTKVNRELQQSDKGNLNGASIIQMKKDTKSKLNNQHWHRSM